MTSEYENQFWVSNEYGCDTCPGTENRPWRTIRRSITGCVKLEWYQFVCNTCLKERPELAAWMELPVRLEGSLRKGHFWG